MGTLDDFGEGEASCVSILVLPDELQPVVEVLDGRVSVLLADEVREWPLEDHHVVEVELVLAVDLDAPEHAVLDQSHKPVETVELRLEL